MATLHGQWMRDANLDQYAGRIQEHRDKTLRQSEFSLGLYGQRWIYAMELWADWGIRLVALKPHKHRYFQRGFYALSLIQQSL